MARRNYTAAPDDQRCQYDIKIHGDQTANARCMRRAVDGEQYCHQHGRKIIRQAMRETAAKEQTP